MNAVVRLVDMTNKYCKHCGRELAAGKRYCSGCGEAIPAALATAPVLPAIQSEPRTGTSICRHCGTTVAAGKAFCKQCGHVVNEQLPASNPAADVCAQCGTLLSPGRRYCRKCGLSVSGPNSPAKPKADVQVPTEVKSSVSLPIASLPAKGPPEQSSGPSKEMPPLFRKGTPKSTVDAEPPKVQIPSKTKRNIIIGAAIILFVAGGLTWYFRAHRSVESSIPPSQLATAQIQITAPTPAPNQSGKPVSGTIRPEASATATPSLASKPVVPPSHTPASPAPIKQPEQVTLQPLAQRSPPPPAPVSPRSGVLQYQGPPVPYNGQVVFDHLPVARLRFTFDHQAWSLTIKRNPDGTKKITLTSQKPGYQTTCDLTWEVVD